MALRRFLQTEAAGGILLSIAAVLALVVANTPLSSFHTRLLDTPVAIQVGALEIAKPMLLWINDGLMAVFFLLIGLELKREIREGDLSSLGRITLPALGAIGGIAVPALIYFLVNRGDSVALAGWAVPTATDIAFALGVLALVGPRIPTALKVLLLSIAIFDDLAAILAIALFYTSKISLGALLWAVPGLVMLFVLNARGTTRPAAFILVGVYVWICVLKSGVHATLAGVITALFIPMRDRTQPGRSPLEELEHALHPWVAFGILPVFAFANAGVSVLGAAVDDLVHPIALGVFLGLVVGKPLGVFLFIRLAALFGIVRRPEGTTWTQLLGVGMLCGIGFTMSLFIGSLAFEETGSGENLVYDRIGILAASLVSAVLGWALLRKTSKDQGAA
ncbi:Na+/H+ antiporter NhaA [bacterium]|nr:Na+/H+ antiporter NhaA [bacterium]